MSKVFPRAVSCVRAANVLNSYHDGSCGCSAKNMDDCEEDKSTPVVDVLADLMHFAWLHHIDFEDALRIARGHFDYEYRHPREIEREDDYE